MPGDWVRTFVLGLTVLWLSACHLTTAPSVSDREVLPLNHLPAISGDYFELDSRAVGRPFHIYVSLPEGYQADRNTRYPVVYVLDRPWALKTVTIEGGTHAADSASSYRVAMLWLFNRNE